jgi:hypothetical protein
MSSPRLLAVLLSLACAVLLAACGAEDAREEGGNQTENAVLAETEGIYLDIDGLKYQVQVSRQLNPRLAEDSDYLSGLAPVDRRLGTDEEWFAVFLRAENEHGEPMPNAIDFAIRDTAENVYRPIGLAPDNVWAYRGTVVEPNELYPSTNSPAGERAPNGALLLFKLRRLSLDNRPLELEITGRDGQRGIVNLDV